MKIIDKIKSELPSDAMITDVSYEGSEIILYTQNKEFFRSNTTLIKSIVDKIKKRIEVRADPSVLKTEEMVKEFINKNVPKDAGIKDIYFEPEFAKVVIHASKPGLVIGRGGMTLNEIKNNTMWTPEIKRAPVIDSEIIRMIRKMLHSEAGHRKKFLNTLGEKIYVDEKKNVEWIRMTSLGGFREVGRSCVLVQTPQTNLLLDCGLSVKKDIEPYPHLDAPEFKIQELDAVIVSHAHMDHGGLVPYLYHYGFKGPLYCTAPTRDTMTMLQLDYIKINKREGEKPLYSTKDMEEMLKHCIVLNYGEVSDIAPDMRLTLQNAGHILGSSSVHIHIGEGLHNLLYTGDMKYGRTKLFEQASTNFTRVESLIIESTYGTEIQPPYDEAEKKLVSVIKETIANGGKVLIPSFAVGRSQDVILALSETDLNIPIYLDGMLWDATAIHTAYPEFMSRDVQNKILHRGNNPFLDARLKGIGSAVERKAVIAEAKPSVIISTSGMLVGGPIMEYLTAFAHDPKNCMIFVGYQGEGTLGRRIQKGWKMVPIENKERGLEMKLRVETVEGFSDHSDQNQLVHFVEALRTKPRRIIVNHGESTKCIELAKMFHKMFRCRTEAPRNLETI
ncbi:MAG: beta-CASP ribonuclease aCPSF1, partial [Candidatus Aenigmatarchaeota archaeon]